MTSTSTPPSRALARLTHVSFLNLSPEFSATQAQIDSGVTHFLSESAQLHTFVSILAGGGAARLFRTGVLALGANATGRAAFLVQGAASVGSIGAEAMAFEVAGRAVDHSYNPNRWRWRGSGGLGQGFYTSTINFTAFRGAGWAAQGQNIVVQHAAQSAAMVTGHNIAGALRVIPAPTESLAMQFFDAERMNLSIGAGMGALHLMAPGMHAFERSLDVGNRARIESSRRTPRGEAWGESMALASVGNGGRSASPDGRDLFNITIVLSENQNGDGRDSRPTLGVLPSRAEGVEAVAPVREGTPRAEAPFDLSEARYQLPVADPYFADLVKEGNIDLDALSVYARGERRPDLVGDNMEVILRTPMKPAEEYSPGGAAKVARQRSYPEYRSPNAVRSRGILVATPGRAILGMGSARIVNGRVVAWEADPIMGGKDKNFIENGGIKAERLCINCELTTDQTLELSRITSPRLRQKQRDDFYAQNFVDNLRTVADPNRFSLINVEDARGADLPIIMEGLRNIGIASWSDDKQGTGGIGVGGFLAWSHLTRRDPLKTRVLIFGAGAGAAGVFDELVNHGVLPENIMVTDRGPNQDDSGVPYPLHRDRVDIANDPFKRHLQGNYPANLTVEEFARGVDVMINLGDVKTVMRDMDWTRRLLENLAPDALTYWTTNPEPGWTPSMVRTIRKDLFWASGNQRFENPVNNFVVFVSMGVGVDIADAQEINSAMTVAAARGMFELVKLDWEGMPEDQRRHHLVPRADDIRLLRYEAAAIAKAAGRSGVSRRLGPNPTPAEIEAYERYVDEEISFQEDLVRKKREVTEDFGRWYYQRRFGDRYAPFALREGERTLYDVAPEIRRDHFEYFAGQVGVARETWRDLVNAQGELHPAALTRALERIRSHQPHSPMGQVFFQQMRIIAHIAMVSPSLGLALALRAEQDSVLSHPYTIFHDPQVLTTVLGLIPEARQDIKAFDRIPAAH